MLGTEVDMLMQEQEQNAEAFKYIIHVHEFELNEYHLGHNVGGVRLNEYGEDHVKRIAEQLRQGSHYPVVVERNQTSVRPDTQHKYPVHFDPELDLRRREVIVRALTKMGIPDADQRVVVAPSFAQPFTGAEAEAAYRAGFRGSGGFGGGAGGFGGFGFGGFGFGGFGGIGGGL
jgi:hypothetical protein